MAAIPSASGNSRSDVVGFAWDIAEQYLKKSLITIQHYGK
jgi:hypothetical protein